MDRVKGKKKEIEMDDSSLFLSPAVPIELSDVWVSTN